MPSIIQAILFISSESKNSIGCLDVIRQARLPIDIVRLDDAKSRAKALNGSHFTITHVPTLVLILEGGSVNLFVGKDKIMGILATLMRPPQPPPNLPSHTSPIVIDDDPEPMGRGHPVDPRPPRPPPKNKKDKKVKFKKSRSEDPETMDLDYVADEPSRTKNPAPPTDNLRVGKPSKSSMKSITKLAKQMEEEAKRTLGYDHNDVDKY